MSDPSFVRPTRGGGGAVVALAGALVLGMLGLVATPSTGADPCVIVVAPGSTEGLIAALSTPGDLTGCGEYEVRISGTFILGASLEWATAVPLRIVGPAEPAGAMARLEGIGGHRLLTLDLAADGAAITLERLILTGGDVAGASSPEDEGGAVLADVLHLIDVEFRGNHADLGGAVSTADLTAVRTSFIGNTADFGDGEGGAIRAVGEVTLTNVTFVGNRAKTGGALHLDVTGFTGRLNATFVTFRENAVLTAGADLHLVADAPADLPISLRGVLFAGPVTFPAGGTPQPSCGGAQFTSTDSVSATSSIAADASCGVAEVPTLATLAFTTVPFRTGTTDLPVPTGDWPGRDAVTCAASGLPTTDQRGVARPQGDACDVGAVEQVVTPAPPPPSPPVEPTPVDEGVEATDVLPPVPTSVPAGGGACAESCPAPRER